MDKNEILKKELGKHPKDMTKEELLMAISAVSAKLYSKTGEKRYKDTEEVTLGILQDLEHGASDDTAVKRAVAMLKAKGYREPNETES